MVRHVVATFLPRLVPKWEPSFCYAGFCADLVLCLARPAAAIICTADPPVCPWTETPHVHEAKLNRGPNGEINTSDKTIRPATKEDVRTARKIVEQEKDRK